MLQVLRGRVKVLAASTGAGTAVGPFDCKWCM
jgi:hypothetical protein